MNLWDWVEDALDVAAWVVRSWKAWLILSVAAVLAGALALQHTG